ncbi:MAG: hypothetical protein AAF899_19495, partial [Pseudomonadota bacterium]
EAQAELSRESAKDGDDRDDGKISQLRASPIGISSSDGRRVTRWSIESTARRTSTENKHAGVSGHGLGTMEFTKPAI